MFRKILVPVDLAELDPSRPAIERATELADIGGGTLRLIHVRAPVVATYMEFVPPDLDLRQHSETEEKLADLAATIPLPKERVSAVVRLGTVYHEVLEEAENTGADLIVVGSHRPTMATYLLGSNASTIVRHARTAVLVVR